MTFAKFISCFLSFAFFTALSMNSHAGSSVWKISHEDHHLYLGGTVHLLSKSDYPLPSQFEEAYQQSSILILEADTSEMQQPSAQQAMMQQAMYPANETIRSKLTPQTYQALQQHCLSRNLDLNSLERFKPGMLSVILTMTELNKLKITSKGVDDYFDGQAKAQQRPMAYLETIDEQLSLIANMGKGQEESFIKYTLEEATQLESVFNQLKLSWRSGDMQMLNDIAITPFKKDFPKLYDALLVERNNKWLPQIKQMLKTKEVELVLAGALHMAGKDGLINQLKTSGYQVEKLH